LWIEMSPCLFLALAFTSHLYSMSYLWTCIKPRSHFSKTYSQSEGTHAHTHTQKHMHAQTQSPQENMLPAVSPGAMLISGYSYYPPPYERGATQAVCMLLQRIINCDSEIQQLKPR
jgi:hypothetical protein